MAKGNLFWNLGRGKVGSLVLSINKGQVVTRQYQPNVANPRSNAQMLQRARFASCVNFYKRASENFFKFAYEDRKPTESDYNAFMRHNTSKTVAPLTREQVKGNFPAIASSWLLSAGSLATPSVLDTRTDMPYLALPSLREAVATVGNVSECLMRDYSLVTGDIITIVHVSANVRDLESPLPEKPSEWDIVQFVVNPASTETLASVSTRLSVAVGKGLLLENQGRLNAVSYGVVFSRKERAQALKVSTSELLPNAAAYNMYVAAQDPDWQRKVLSTWGASGTAVLEGAYLSAQGSPIIETIKGDPVPRVSETVFNTGVTSTAEITGKNLSGLTVGDFRGEGVDVSKLEIQSDTAANLTLTGTGSAPTSWSLYYLGQLIARHSTGEASITSVSPSSSAVLDAGDTVTLTARGQHLDAVKASDFTASDTHLTVQSVKYNNNGTLTIVLKATAQVTAATLSFGGAVIFEIMEQGVTITSGTETLSSAGSHTLKITGTGLDTLTKSSFTVYGGQITSYTAAAGGASADMVVSVDEGGNFSVSYGGKTIAEYSGGSLGD